MSETGQVWKAEKTQGVIKITEVVVIVLTRATAAIVKINFENRPKGLSAKLDVVWKGGSRSWGWHKVLAWATGKTELPLTELQMHWEEKIRGQIRSLTTEC